MKVSVSELIDRNKWEEICKAKRINPWAYNEGILPAEIELTNEEGLRFGLWATAQATEETDESSSFLKPLSPTLPPEPEDLPGRPGRKELKP